MPAEIGHASAEEQEEEEGEKEEEEKRKEDASVIHSANSIYGADANCDADAACGTNIDYGAHKQLGPGVENTDETRGNNEIRENAKKWISNGIVKAIAALLGFACMALMTYGLDSQ